MSTTLKDLTKTRDLKAGHFVFEFATPGIGHILKQAGSDFVFLDCEHSGFGMETSHRRVRGPFPFPYRARSLSE